MRRHGATMIGRGLLAAAVLSSCVLSLPVTSGQLENEDVKVMKCIVEALADVLSRPHPVPVSQECVLTLKSDDRLVTILRHHNFLKELQEIAVQGTQERALLQQDAVAPQQVTQTPPATDDIADRSMLEALGGPGERSILSQKRNEDGEDDSERPPDGEQQQQGEEGEEEEKGEGGGTDAEVKRGDEENPGRRIPESAEAEKREEEEEKRADLSSEEENTTKEKKGPGSDEKRESKSSKEKKAHNEEEEDKDKRFSEEEGMKRWTKRAKGRGRAKETRLLEGSHHSQEAAATAATAAATAEKSVGGRRSPEEQELQMIASREPEQRRMLEEEGSASRRSEEPEIESLAAIESELENVAQKLHDLRRG